MKKAVIGIGNRLMMDDGIGVYIVEGLAVRDKMENTNYIIGETDLDYCISRVDEGDYIILIDATILGKQPGNISIIPLEEIVYPEHIVYSHDFHLFNILKLRGYKGILIGIEPFLIDYNFGLSETLKKRYNKLLIAIEKIIVEL